MKTKISKIFKNLIIIAVWLGIWQTASMITGLEILFAGPVAIFKEFFVLIVKREFYITILSSMLRITIGFVISFTIGVILGGVAGKFRLFKDFLEPPMQLMKSLPAAAVIIIILMWFGSENVSLIVSGMVVIPLIYISIVQGIVNLDSNLREMSDIFKIGIIKRIRYVYFPQVYPYLVSSCKVALGMCWKAGVSAEVIGLASNSIGSQMYYSKIYLLSADLFVWSIVVIVLSVVFEKLFLWILLVVKKVLAC